MHTQAEKGFQRGTSNCMCVCAHTPNHKHKATVTLSITLNLMDVEESDKHFCHIHQDLETTHIQDYYQSSYWVSGVNCKITTKIRFDYSVSITSAIGWTHIYMSFAKHSIANVSSLCDFLVQHAYHCYREGIRMIYSGQEAADMTPVDRSGNHNGLQRNLEERLYQVKPVAKIYFFAQI